MSLTQSLNSQKKLRSTERLINMSENSPTCKKTINNQEELKEIKQKLSYPFMESLHPTRFG